MLGAESPGRLPQWRDPFDPKRQQRSCGEAGKLGAQGADRPAVKLDERPSLGSGGALHVGSSLVVILIGLGIFAGSTSMGLAQSSEPGRAASAAIPALIGTAWTAAASGRDRALARIAGPGNAAAAVDGGSQHASAILGATANATSIATSKVRVAIGRTAVKETAHAAATVQSGGVLVPTVNSFPSMSAAETSAQPASETGQTVSALGSEVSSVTANDTARGKGGGRAAKAPGTAWQGGPNSAASLSQPSATAAADWPGVDFRALAAGAFPPINGSPIDRARRLIALGLGVEALAVLGQADPLDRAYPFLKGAAACLADRPDAVLVFDRVLDAEPEIGFWRTVAALRLSRAVDPAALRAAIGTLLAYPKEIARRFVPLILDAMLAKRSLSDAARLAELIPLKWPELAGEPAIQLLQGRVHLAAGDTDKARNIFEVVARSADFASAVAARKYLVDADVAAGRLNPAAALILLDRQRPLWRGQDFEESFMDDLASIADQAGLVDRQLAVLSEIASSAANAEDHDRALAAVRAALLAAVDRHDLGAKLRVMAYVRMQPQLAEGAGDGLRVRAIAKDQAETMGLPLQALAGNFSKFESPSNPAAAASTADDRKIVIEPPPRKPAVLNVAAMVDSAALPPIGKVAGEPDAIAAALDREIAAAHAVLAAARETPSSSSPLAP